MGCSSVTRKETACLVLSGSSGKPGAPCGDSHTSDAPGGDSDCPQHMEPLVDSGRTHGSECYVETHAILGCQACILVGLVGLVSALGVIWRSSRCRTK